jgi:hypothetical protein
MLEIYMHAVGNNTGDDFLDTINLGVGNYDEPEYWQQIDTFKTGMYADAAMTRKVVRRAILETKMRIVDAIYGDGDAKLLERGDVAHPRPDGLGKGEYLEEHMDDVWDGLGIPEEGYSTEEHQAWMVNRATSLGMDWTPPHWRMLKARHEASRSKDARLIDNVFGRPPENAAPAPAAPAAEEF